jgi:hypothetical protein
MYHKNKIHTSALCITMLAATSCFGMNLEKTTLDTTRLIHYLDEKNIAKLARVSTTFYTHYPEFAEQTRRERVKEFIYGPDTITIPIDELNFPILGLNEKMVKPQDVQSISIPTDSIVVPAKKPFFLGIATIDWSPGKNYTENCFMPVQCTYSSNGLISFKPTKKLPSVDAPFYFTDPAYCTDMKKQARIVSSYDYLWGNTMWDNNRDEVLHITTPNAETVIAQIDGDIDKQTITYDGSGRFIVGAYPKHVFISFNADNSIVIERDIHFTNIFGQTRSLDTIHGLEHVKKHIFDSAEIEKIDSKTTLSKNGITHIAKKYLLKRKPDDTSWNDETITALGAYLKSITIASMGGVPIALASYHKLSDQNCAEIVIALTKEKEEKAAGQMLEELIDKKIWTYIHTTPHEINALGRKRVRNHALRQWWSKVGAYTAEVNPYNPDTMKHLCQTLVPPTLLNSDNVSFSDETKLTPSRLINIVRTQAEHEASLVPQEPETPEPLYASSLFE